jgi:poly(3-hydroxybutyrate) depolymerase
MKPIRIVLAALVLCVLAPVDGLTQALTNLSSVRVGYNTRKATVQPDGDLKVKIDALDREIAEAARFGRSGELRRLYAKGLVLLSGREWTDALDFSNSLVLRTDRVIVDSTKPYTVRLEQLYAPSLQLPRSLIAKPAVQRPAARGRGGAAAPAEGGRGRGGRGETPAGAAAAPDIIKALGTIDGVSRDLRESPQPIDLDLSGIADGAYQVVVDVLDGTTSLGSATLSIAVRKGVDEEVTRLEAAAAKAPAALRADILFPVDRMRQINRGRLTLSTFNPERDFAAAAAVAAAAASGKDPFAGRTGDFKRHHLLASANEIMPYRMLVPAGYAASKPSPLIIALHGLGGTEDSFFSNYEGVLPKLAGERGYIVAAPLGYRVDGFYGWGVGDPPEDPEQRRSRQRSEDDVMAVLKLVREQYNIDPNRIYLMGHSMGGIGTWTLAPKFPDIWAAIAPIAGSGAPATLERIRHVPQIVVHGDADRTVNVQGSRRMVTRMKELAMEVKYIEVPGGGHSDVVAPNIPAIVDFFDTHRKK